MVRIGGWVLLGLLLTGEGAFGQSPFGRGPTPGGGGNFGGFGAPFQPATPTYSPYLNLLRGGGTTVFNYYGLVRPEQQFRQSFQGLEQQFGDLQQLSTGNNQASGIFTGNRARFLSTGGYFMSNNTGGGGGGGGGGGAFVLTTPIQSPLTQSIQITNPNLRPDLNNGQGANPGRGRR
jgi:hypothetical protein